MPKRTPSTAPTKAPSIGAVATRATSDATRRYRQRFASRFVADYFRDTAANLSVSSMGIGTYLGESTDADDAAYQATLRRAIGSGVNLIDTAINYRSQRSERAIGAALQHVLADGTVSRDEIVVCSKGGYIPLDRTPPASREAYQAYVRREFIDPEILRPDEITGGGHSLAPRFLRFCLAKSRQNMGLRVVDIYYIHNPGQLLGTLSRRDGRTRLRAAFAVLEEAASRGEIGVYGCATWDELRVAPDVRGHLELEEAVGVAHELAGDAHHFRVLQFPINLGMLEAVRLPTQTVGAQPRTALEAADELGLTVIASASLLQSRLTEGLPAELRSHFPELRTDAQRALSFVRTLPAVTAALVGMKSIAHLDENIEAASSRVRPD